MAQPAYTRLAVDERRSQLLALGRDLFTRHAYDELSMADIAREAGISKALLYHYFPSKQEYFQATLATAAEQLRALTEPDPELAPVDALRASVEVYLRWIDENRLAYSKLIQSSTSHGEVRDLIVVIRDATSVRIVDLLSGGRPTPARVRTAVRAWLWFMDGACSDWIERADYSREELGDLLMETLFGALRAAGGADLIP